MKLLYATNNYTKIYNMKRRLEGLPIEIVTPKELGIYVDVDENGETAVENAIKKAQAYHNIANMPTIAADVSLYIDNIAAERQPGLFVRRVEGKVLTDEEMLTHYINLVNDAGGKTTAYYIKGLALITEKGLSSIEIKENKFIMTNTPASGLHEGYPIDTISIDPGSNKYYVDMSDEEAKNIEKIFESESVKFIRNNLFNDEEILQNN